MVDENKDEKGNTGLHKAVLLRDKKLVETLCEDGADVNSTNIYGNTALHIAVWIGDEKLVKTLCEARADVNSTNISGNTALHIAVAKGDKELIKTLCEYGADVNAKDIYGNTALHLAAAKDDKKLVKYLCSKDARINESNIYGNTPLHNAAYSKNLDVFQYLLEQGSNVNFLNKNGKTPKDIAQKVFPLESSDMVRKDKTFGNYIAILGLLVIHSLGFEGYRFLEGMFREYFASSNHRKSEAADKVPEGAFAIPIDNGNDLSSYANKVAAERNTGNGVGAATKII